MAAENRAMPNVLPELKLSKAGVLKTIDERSQKIADEDGLLGRRDIAALLSEISKQYLDDEANVKLRSNSIEKLDLPILASTEPESKESLGEAVSQGWASAKGALLQRTATVSMLNQADITATDNLYFRSARAVSQNHLTEHTNVSMKVMGRNRTLQAYLRYHFDKFIAKGYNRWLLFLGIMLINVLVCCAMWYPVNSSGTMVKAKRANDEEDADMDDETESVIPAGRFEAALWQTWAFLVDPGLH